MNIMFILPIKISITGDSYIVIGELFLRCGGSIARLSLGGLCFGNYTKSSKRVLDHLEGEGF